MPDNAEPATTAPPERDPRDAALVGWFLTDPSAVVADALSPVDAAAPPPNPASDAAAADPMTGPARQIQLRMPRHIVFFANVVLNFGPFRIPDEEQEARFAYFQRAYHDGIEARGRDGNDNANAGKGGGGGGPGGKGAAPPLHCLRLSPRMIIGSESKRRALRDAVNEFLDGLARSAEVGLLDEVTGERRREAERKRRERERRKRKKKRKGKQAGGGARKDDDAEVDRRLGGKTEEEQERQQDETISDLGGASVTAERAEDGDCDRLVSTDNYDAEQQHQQRPEESIVKKNGAVVDDCANEVTDAGPPSRLDRDSSGADPALQLPPSHAEHEEENEDEWEIVRRGGKRPAAADENVPPPNTKGDGGRDKTKQDSRASASTRPSKAVKEKRQPPSSYLAAAAEPGSPSSAATSRSPFKKKSSPPPSAPPPVTTTGASDDNDDCSISEAEEKEDDVDDNNGDDDDTTIQRLESQLESQRRHHLEMIQQVQLKAFVAETRAEAALERSRELERKILDATYPEVVVGGAGDAALAVPSTSSSPQRRSPLCSPRNKGRPPTRRELELELRSQRRDHLAMMQRVQLRTYLAETKARAAEERTGQLEGLLEDAREGKGGLVG